jgi:hypothetical protein
VYQWKDIDGTTKTNISVGYDALSSVSGENNIAFGTSVLKYITTALMNVGGYAVLIL